MISPELIIPTSLVGLHIHLYFAISPATFQGIFSDFQLYRGNFERGGKKRLLNLCASSEKRSSALFRSFPARFSGFLSYPPLLSVRYFCHGWESARFASEGDRIIIAHAAGMCDEPARTLVNTFIGAADAGDSPSSPPKQKAGQP